MLIAASERELPTLVAHRFVQQADALRANDYEAMNRKLFGFLDRLVATYAEKKRQGERVKKPLR